MSTKYTSGPWQWAGTGPVMSGGYTQPFGIAAGKNLIAGCFGDVFGGEEVAKANAQLIAAAPDLLEACKAALRLDYFQEHNALAKQVRDAITKAEEP